MRFHWIPRGTFEFRREMDEEEKPHEIIAYQINTLI